MFRDGDKDPGCEWRFDEVSKEVECMLLHLKMLCCKIIMDDAYQGRNWVILRGGRRFIYKGKDEIIHGLGPSVKYVNAPLFRDIRA